MSEFDQLYRELILDHYKNPRNYGLLDPADAHAEGQNPLCGDEIFVSVRLGEGDVIEEVGFDGRGCAISQAATSMLSDLVKGKTAGEVAAMPKEELLDELGIPLTPAVIGRLWARHLGIGADGILELLPPTEPGYVAQLRILNPDGSEAELSGNGAREALLYLVRAGWTDARGCWGPGRARRCPRPSAGSRRRRPGRGGPRRPRTPGRAPPPGPGRRAGAGVCRVGTPAGVAGTPARRGSPP